ncbi:Formate dehydrogenase -O, gamma subunit [hydrothermal vent metagenome]|uniref:Formate dehydrogenase -O, gamma subunit n=1 Tax=hydrothermal vent metagenome TaxID=652676 RepID=A0A3B0RBL2_9ZZZZ
MGLQKLVTALFLFALIIVSAASFTNSAQAQSVRPPSNAVNQPTEEQAGTSNTLGTESQSEYWRKLRYGAQGKVSIPDSKLGVLVQSEGWDWMQVRNGPLKTYGGFALAIIIAMLTFFFLYRGQIKVESGMSGTKILRFGKLARYGHWLNAIAFVLLALTGLNMLYGRTVLLPLIGPDGFSTITIIGKFVHNWGAFAFILGIVWIFVAFVGKNFLSKDDFGWVMKAGGMLKKGVHPPAKFFNFGEKVVFWISILGGIGIIVTGLALLFPYQLEFMPGELAVHKMQFASLWHSIIGLGLTVVIIGHIYIGTIGMEGSLSSMTNGYVDRNWAKEHHSLWLEELDEKASSKSVSKEPAE